MVVTKKLKDLTDKERNICGWIERIAYRGNEAWTMYDFEAEDFAKIRQKDPKVYDELNIVMGKKWFAIYREDPGMITLLNIAKMDIGDGQEDAKRQIQDFTREIVDTNKVIFVVARESTSYYTFVKLAAAGEIQICQDRHDEKNNTTDMIFFKPDGKKDLEAQKQEYKEKLAQFEKNKIEHKKARLERLEYFIEQLKAEVGEKGLREIIDRI